MKFLQWVIGIAFTSLLLHLIGVQKEKVQWPVAQAVVDSTKIIETVDSFLHPLFELQVNFSYEFNDATYTSKNIVAYSSEQRLIEQEVDRYPAGSTITIRYAPDRPFDPEIKEPESSGSLPARKKRHRPSTLSLSL